MNYHIDNSTVSQGFGNSAFNYGRFGITRNNGYFHDGVDVAGPSGTPILAHEDGVSYAGWEPGGYGNYVVFTGKSGNEIWYGHLKNPGHIGPIKRGQIIGLRGSTGNSTGPHTHISVYPPGRNRNNGVRGAIDPNDYFKSNIGDDMPYTDQQYNDMKAQRDIFAEAWAAEKFFHMRGKFGSREEHRRRLGMVWEQANADIEKSTEWKNNLANPWWASSTADKKLIEIRKIVN